MSDHRRSGVAILLVEQNARAALQFSDFGYVQEAGAIIFEGLSADLIHDQCVAETYLGVAARSLQ